MKHIRRFNDSLKENSKYQESPITFIGAYSKGIIEYGAIHIRTSMDSKGDDLYITIEQYSDGSEKFLLDNLDDKEKLESFGIEIDDEEIIGPQEFLNDLHSFYDGKSRL